jgi:hypothetical protein
MLKKAAGRYSIETVHGAELVLVRNQPCRDDAEMIRPGYGQPFFFAVAAVGIDARSSNTSA